MKKLLISIIEILMSERVRILQPRLKRSPKRYVIVRPVRQLEYELIHLRSDLDMLSRPR